MTKALHRAGPILSQISADLVQALTAMGFMEVDASKGPVGFHSDMIPHLMQSGEYFRHLEKEVNTCNELQRKIYNALERRDSADVLKSLRQAVSSMLVQPDESVIAVLDSVIRDGYDKVPSVTCRTEDDNFVIEIGRKLAPLQIIKDDELLDATEYVSTHPPYLPRARHSIRNHPIPVIQ